jgi:hypothetical protein
VLLSALTVSTSVPLYVPTFASIHLTTLQTGTFVVLTLATCNLKRLKFARGVRGNITLGRDREFLSCDITIRGTTFRSLTSGVPRNFFRGGVQQIQLRTEGREKGERGGSSPLVRRFTQFVIE